MGIFNKNSTSGSVVATGNPVANQLLGSFSIALGNTPSPFVFPKFANFGGKPLNFFNINLSLSGVAGSTAPSGMQPIEYTISRLVATDRNASTIFNLNGSKNDISITARLSNPHGTWSPSPTPSTPAASGDVSASWNFQYFHTIPISSFDLFSSGDVNTLASATSGSTTLASATDTATIKGNYYNVPEIRTKWIITDVPVASTGSINLSPYLAKDVNTLILAMQYGSDSNIGSSGDGITFSANGNLQLQNVSLADLINVEDIVYKDSVSQGSGHVNGLITLVSPQAPFQPTFASTSQTQFSVDFTSAPTLLNSAYTNTIRLYQLVTY